MFVTATGEADSLLAELCRRGDVAGVVSTDMDMLARGVPVLIIPESADAGFLTTIRLVDVLRGLQMEFEVFVRACVMMGTDYSPSRMNPWTAVATASTSAGTNEVAETSGNAEDDATKAADDKVFHLLTDRQPLEELLAEKQLVKWIAGTQQPEKENLDRTCKEQGWPLSWKRVLGNIGA